MKKVQVFGLMALCIVGFISLLGCPTPTAPKPGNNDTGNTNSGGDSTAASLYGFPYEVDTDFAYDVWSNTFTATDVSEGGQRIVVGTQNWAGGSFARVISPKTTFNFTNVKRVKFQIRSGNMNPAWFTFLLQNPNNILSKNLKTDLSITNLDGTTWTNVEIDVSAFYNKKITSAFSFVIANDPEGVPAGTWFEIRNINWVDTNGNSINICEGEPVIETPTYPNTYYLFKSDGTLAEGITVGNWDSGSTLTIMDDPSRGKVYKVEPGNGWDAPSSCIAFWNLMVYQDVYNSISFKIKSTDLTEICVKIPEVEKYYSITGGADLGNGWYEITVPFADYSGTAPNNTGIGILGGWNKGGVFYITDIRFNK
ncbi:MAG: hypothetical protein N2Z76_05460 [Treponemataceae bacterium]|nr:hypothetical protein [Treponemataceae bacterium]